MRTYTTKDFLEDAEIIIDKFKKGEYTEEQANLYIKTWMEQIGKEM